jgi:hypothetical protein
VMCRSRTAALVARSVQHGIGALSGPRLGPARPSADATAKRAARGRALLPVPPFSLT